MVCRRGHRQPTTTDDRHQRGVVRSPTTPAGPAGGRARPSRVATVVGVTRTASRLVAVSLVTVVGLVVLATSVGFVGTASAAGNTAPDCSTVSYADADSDGFLDVDSTDKLQCITKGLGKDYELTSDINASGTVHWNSGAGFKPIGRFKNQFTGTFNGSDHTISGLTIDRINNRPVGLFNSVGSGGVVENVGVENADITGMKPVGGLVGYNSGGTLDASYVTGNVTATNFNGASVVGGLVGRNAGTVTNSYATANVTGSGDYVGGLVGLNVDSLDEGTVTNSYATANVTGSSYVGGLVGYNAGTKTAVNDSYATGSVDGSGENVGGLVGQNEGTVDNGYWDVGTTTQSSAIGSDSGTTSGLTGFGSVGDATPAPEMVGINATVRMTALDFSTAWRPGGSDDAYPDLAWDSSFAGSADAFDALVAGDGTSGLPYQVEHVYDLQAIRERVGNGEQFTLANDISASATSAWSGGNGFEPIGDATTALTGTFNGSDHTISGLTIDRSTEESVGLFGYVDGGVVENVGVENADITGNRYVGGLVGQSVGGSTVTDSSVTGSVTGTRGEFSDVGGLVGYNAGTVTKSSANGSIDGSGDVGGLVGWNAVGGTVSDSSATGSVDGSNQNVGGLVGFNAGTVTESATTGDVSGNTDVGGLAGENDAGTVTDSSATGSVTGHRYVGGLVGNNDAGTVTSSSATGSVTGTSGEFSDAGGLVGYNAGTVSESSATGSVTGSGDVGGFAGWNAAGGTVTDSYASGSVTGSTENVGGLVGFNNGTVDKSYAVGAVDGNTSVGGLAGQSLVGATVSDSYWDTESTGQPSSAGSPEANGLTTSEMQRFAPLVTMDGFSFESPQTWLVISGYPALAWQDVTELTVEGVEATSPTVGEDEPGTITVTATESGTDAGEGVSVEVLDNSSLDGFATGETTVTDTSGQVTFTFDEPDDGTYTPEFAWAGDTTVSATSTVTVQNASELVAIAPASGESNPTNAGSVDDASGRISRASTTTVEDTSHAVTGTRSDDGTVSFEVADPDGGGAVTLDLRGTLTDGSQSVTGSDGSGAGDGETGNAVSVDRLSITPTESGSREFEVSVREWVASTDTRERGTDGAPTRANPRPFPTETGLTPMGYVELTHTNPDTDIETVTFRFRVRKAALKESGGDPDGVTLYRDEHDGWAPLRTEQVTETATHYGFETVSPGLSLFSITSTQPVFEAAPASSPAGTVTVSEQVTVDATVRNLGETAGTYTAKLRANGTVVATSDVEVASNSTQTVSLSFTPATPGEYTLTVGTVTVGTISVQSAADSNEPALGLAAQANPQQTAETTDAPPQPAADTSDTAPTTDVGGPGLGVLVAFGVLLTVVVVLIRRRS